MYEYLKGTLTHKNPTYVVLEVGGIGYRLEVSLTTYTAIEKQEKAQLLTYLHVKEDVMQLYGFSERKERDLFELLLRVSGIGTNTARLILSAMKAEEVETAIRQEDSAAFKAVKGVGTKTAQRIILDCKDKIGKGEEIHTTQSASSHNTMQQEAFSALLALGFQQGQVRKALQKVRQSSDANTVEDYIKEGLKILS